MRRRLPAAAPSAAVVLLLLSVLSGLAAAAEPDDVAVRHRLLLEALTQAERPRPDWDPGQRDCAGFVRLLYRKATGSPASMWTGRDGQPASFLAAEELLAYNFTPVSREPARSRVVTGDLLAYFDETEPPTSAWHLMVLLTPTGAVPDRVLAVYHNGAAGSDAGIRKVWLDDLVSGPPEWRPVAGNPRFLGTFRWNGWAPASPRSHPSRPPGIVAAKGR